jgi:antitoxin (DNA-binding transcriptional repressor) of toxin-antitoxin stability system
MTAIFIHELHEHTSLWVGRATNDESIIVEDNGRPVAQLVALPQARPGSSPSIKRKILPSFLELQAKLTGGTDSTDLISEMREDR